MIFDDIQKGVSLNVIKGNKAKAPIQSGTFKKGQWASLEKNKFDDNVKNINGLEGAGARGSIQVDKEKMIIFGQTSQKAYLVKYDKLQNQLVLLDSKPMNINYKVFGCAKGNEVFAFSQNNNQLIYSKIIVSGNNLTIAVNNTITTSYSTFIENVLNIKDNEYFITGYKVAAYIRIVNDTSVELIQQFDSKFFFYAAYESNKLVLIFGDNSKKNIDVSLYNLESGSFNLKENKIISFSSFGQLTRYSGYISEMQKGLFVFGSYDGTEVLGLALIDVNDNTIQVKFNNLLLPNYESTYTYAYQTSNEIILIYGKQNINDNTIYQTIAVSKIINKELQGITDITTFQTSNSLLQKNPYALMPYLYFVSRSIDGNQTNTFDTMPKIISYNDTNPCVVLENGTQGQEVEIVEP